MHCKGIHCEGCGKGGLSIGAIVVICLTVIALINRHAIGNGLSELGHMLLITAEVIGGILITGLASFIGYKITMIGMANRNARINAVNQIANCCGHSCQCATQQPAHVITTAPVRPALYGHQAHADSYREAIAPTVPYQPGPWYGVMHD